MKHVLGAIGFLLLLLAALVVGIWFNPAQAHAQAAISCDGNDRYASTLRYACAIVDYRILAQWDTAFRGRGRVAQIWLRTANPDVVGFLVRAQWMDAHGLNVISNQVAAVNFDRAMQTIVEIPIGDGALTAATIDELASISSMAWQ